MIAKDRASYQYLVESIRNFPDQETFLAMLRHAGFGSARYRNLSMGIACAAFGLEDLMRGPHNILRLIRTGATFERTGAMKLVLEAMDAPPRLRAVVRVVLAGRSAGWAIAAIRAMPPAPAR